MNGVPAYPVGHREGAVVAPSGPDSVSSGARSVVR